MDERPKRERKVFLLRGHFLDEAGRQKSRILQKVSCEAYGGDLRRFLNTALGQIERLASERGIPMEHLYAVSARHGNDGEPVIVELQPVIPTQRWLTAERDHA
jgi:hypothetical protein